MRFDGHAMEETCGALSKIGPQKLPNNVEYIYIYLFIYLYIHIYTYTYKSTSTMDSLGCTL